MRPLLEMTEGMPHAHERRFQGGVERLRSPERVALLEVQKVVLLSREGLELTSILDVGTGTGIFAEAFLGETVRVVGIDPNPELLSAARRLVPHANFLEGVAEALPFEDASFDLVFLGHVLHEADDPRAVLEEVRRVARFRAAVLEWPFRREEMGPPLQHRMEPSRIMELARVAGYASIERTELKHMDFYRLQPRPLPPSP